MEKTNEIYRVAGRIQSGRGKGWPIEQGARGAGMRSFGFERRMDVSTFGGWKGTEECSGGSKPGAMGRLPRG